jgi:opacity protein-like surface antigen
MKTVFSILSLAAFFPAFAGGMGSQETSMGTTYLFIGGGYYTGQYQSNYTNYFGGALTTQQSFNNSISNNGYGQIGLGTGAKIGSFLFDHQFAIGKLGGSDTFNALNSNWYYKQTIDYGYDFMPKVSLWDSLNAYGILGAHYARFTYQKNPFPASATTFNNGKDQIGFNLGAGFNYRITPNFAVGIKYQHWQYGSIQINGANPAATSIDIENIIPAFNLAGIELRYYWS